MEFLVSFALSSSKDTSNDWAKGISPCISSEVTLGVLKHDSLEPDVSKGNSWVEGSCSVVSDLDKSSKGQDNGQGSQDTIAGWSSVLALDHQDDTDKYIGA